MARIFDDDTNAIGLVIACLRDDANLAAVPTDRVARIGQEVEQYLQQLIGSTVECGESGFDLDVERSTCALDLVDGEANRAIDEFVHGDGRHGLFRRASKTEEFARETKQAARRIADANELLLVVVVEGSAVDASLEEVDVGDDGGERAAEFVHDAGGQVYVDGANLNAMVGVQINIPIDAGGMIRAQEREAAERLAKARAELELAREEVGQQARSAWQGLETGVVRIAALQDAQTASSARLDATRLGREVGDRTLLDVLGAENDHAQTVLALAQARSDQVLTRLRLAALADRLDEDLLAQVSATLNTEVAQEPKP